MKVQCCVCQRIRKGKSWESPTAEELFNLRPSHGYCPKCAERAFGELRRSKAKPQTTAPTL